MQTRPTVIMCAMSQSALADAICALDPSIIPVKMRWESYESSNPDLVILEPDKLRRANVVFIADIKSPAHAIEQWAVLCALQTYGAHSLTIYAPYFPGTLDRIDVPGRIVWAKSAARLFSTIPMLHGTGPARVVIYDIHAEQEPFFFADTIWTDAQTSTQYLVGLIEAEQEVDAIAFPDEGAYKRFKRYFPNHEHIICEKRRDGEKRIVTIKEGSPAGKRVLILDDLIISGGTLVQCAHALRGMGAIAVSALAPHLVCPDLAVTKFTSDGPIDTLFVSDSIPTDELESSDGTIQVLSLDRLVKSDIDLNVGT